MAVDDDNGDGADTGFGAVYVEHVDAIYGFLARRVGAELAEDLTAQTFLEALARPDRYDPERGPIGPWLYGIAVNLLRRHYRQEERGLRAIAAYAGRPSVAAEDDEERSDNRLVAEGRWPKIAGALLDMGPGERDVLLLYAWADLTYRGVAGVLDVPVGTVRSRLSRARGRLIAALTDPPSGDQSGRRR
ncbi:MAG TPA: sigma-70 family RNA polymerase sigma factor [Iamia sp.]|nr:sigma-70 family RNA polymerase sigma factor [Iamia sp.]